MFQKRKCGMNPGKMCALFFAAFMVTGLSIEFSGDLSAREERALFNRAFFADLRRTPRIKRDLFLEERVNSLIVARGIIAGTSEKNAFGKRFRVVLKDPEAGALGISIVYHLYTDSLHSMEMLPEQRLFEFSGRLVAYTPTSTKRESYILDVIMEKGAVVIE
jgi:hypothetical protein